MKNVIVILFIIFLATGCSVSYSPAINSVDITKVDFSKIEHFTTGEACEAYYFGFGPFGGAKITSAIKNAQIKKVKAVEYETHNYLFVSKHCICVYGE